MFDIIITPMDSVTAPKVAELEALCFSSPWPKESFINILNNNNALYLTALCGETVVGYIGVFNLVDECSVINVATHPDHRGKGIGRRLMEDIHLTARGWGCEKSVLEVRRSNTAARTLYEHLGYTEYGVEKDYYSDPKEDAILYELNLKERT